MPSGPSAGRVAGAAPAGEATAGGGRRRRFTVDALFADGRPQAVGVTDLAAAKEIRLDRIEPDPDQPRRTFDEDKLAELAASIAREGVLQPIVVRYDAGRDAYVVVHGERRWRASGRAGLATIPAIVRDVPPDRRLIHQLMENVVRDDLNAVERAAALRALKTQLDDAPWEQVAEAVGIRRSRLFQLLGTEKLPAAAQEDIRAGRLSEKQSRALQGLAPGEQEALRAAMVAEDLPAEEGLRLARALRAAHDGAPYDREDAGAAAAALAGVRDEDRGQRTEDRGGVGGRGEGSSWDEPSTPAAPARAGRGRVGEPAGAGGGEDAAEDAAAVLLSALAAAADGGRAERAALARAAESAGAAAYDAERLRAEVLALARTLARAPAADLRPGGPAYGPLAALCGALDAVLR